MFPTTRLPPVAPPEVVSSTASPRPSRVADWKRLGNVGLDLAGACLTMRFERPPRHPEPGQTMRKLISRTIAALVLATAVPIASASVLNFDEFVGTDFFVQNYQGFQ